MAAISKTVATLRIIGDDLIPSEITELLSCIPSREMTKGEPFIWAKKGKPRIARSGMWRLEALDKIPGDLDKQVEELLSKLTCDLSVWVKLSNKYSIDLFCGLFMDSDMEGLSLSPKSMLLLAERGIEIGFDIYGPD